MWHRGRAEEEEEEEGVQQQQVQQEEAATVEEEAVAPQELLGATCGTWGWGMPSCGHGMRHGAHTTAAAATEQHTGRGGPLPGLVFPIKS